MNTKRPNKRTNTRWTSTPSAITFRLTKTLHARLARMAIDNGRSMNAEITRAVEARLEKFEAKGDSK